MKPPLGIRLLNAVRKQPDWSSMSAAQLAAFRVAENRKRSAASTRLVSGFPDRAVSIGWQEVHLPDRVVRTRVYQPKKAVGLPLILHVHGGGFVGTAVQSDWINSHLAAQLPATVVSVEHRLLSEQVPLSAAAEDCWEVLRRATQREVVLFGESAGGAMAALTAIRARDAGLKVRAQVLVNPCVDVSETALDYPSMREHATSPTLTVTQMRLFLRLAEPTRSNSPLYAADLAGLPPTLIVIPDLDPLADQGRAYAERLWNAGTTIRVTEHPGATHAFMSMPGVVPQARVARAEITDFLRAVLATPPRILPWAPAW